MIVFMYILMLRINLGVSWYITLFPYEKRAIKNFKFGKGLRLLINRIYSYLSIGYIVKMELKIKQIYLFLPVALQPISAIRRVIFKFLCHTDKQN